MRDQLDASLASERKRDEQLARSRPRSGALPAPGLTLLWALLVAAALAYLIVHLALAQPWLGLSVHANAQTGLVETVTPREGSPADLGGVAGSLTITAIEATSGNRIAPERLDLTEEPDSLETYAQVERFMARQGALAAMLREPAVTLHTLDPATGTTGAIMLTPVQRPIWSLPPVFWVQVLSGLAGFGVGAWILALRRSDLASQMFALSGLGLMVSALPAALYSTRELALPSDLFVLLSAANHAGVHMFGGALIALFAVYPRRLLHPAWLLVMAAAIAAWWVADVAHLFPDPTVGTYLPMLAQMLAIVALVLVQAHKVRKSPTERAALRWLGLSVVVGAGAFVAGIGVPILVGGEPALSQGYAFAFFFIVYGGIALGIRRYRLFDLGEWSFRILFYGLGAMLLLALDMALIWLLNVEHAPALGVSLLVVAFLYLPFRDALHRTMTGRPGMARHELFAVAMDVAFAATAPQRAERWRALLGRLFDPLEIVAAPRCPGRVEADEDGIALCLPAIADAPPLRLRYPHGGKGLFGSADLLLARELVALIERAAESRNAYERGALEERQRIARDLHDDVGGRLLTGLHTADGKSRPMIKAALSDIRAIVSGLNGEHSPLERVLAEARHEAARRLESAEIELDWPITPDSADHVMLDYRRAKALVSSVREIITNVIRHANARRVRCVVGGDGRELVLTLSDDGVGLTQASTEGYGLRNIRQRIEALDGRLTIVAEPPGTRITIAMPLA